ncbi:ShlB/FhaC/HecB family hemolysin secretion/activation protein [Acinetobacter sp. WZC-1]|uniref:ShlB/FhaC/HecB family hemolysin secretion/activation protein n=1 Tax=Acinetobacter sp. WZC-1 TaxID=3459034 RepID=UPI00403E1414
MDSVHAADDPSLPEVVRQDQRLNELEKQLTDGNVQLNPQQARQKLSAENIIVTETPCFRIDRLEFVLHDPASQPGTDTFSKLFYDLNRPGFITGQCVGTESLQNIVRYGQNELIRQGYITTQLAVQPQDLNQGVLRLDLYPGRIDRIISRDHAITKIGLYSALPLSGGEILNLRKIDQGLENLKRVSGREVDIRIEPAVAEDGTERAGYSHVVVSAKPYRKATVSIGADNSGYKSTGRYLGNIGLTLNNPLHLNDTLYMNASHSLDNWDSNMNRSWYINYAVPFRNYDFSASFNEYTYEQNTPGFNGPPITYEGKTRQGSATLSRLLSRGPQHKTSLYGRGYHKTTRNTFGGIRLSESQDRTTAGWNLGIQHRQYLGSGLLDVALDYRRGTGAFNAKPAPEERIRDIYGNPLPVEGYARAPLWTADIRYTQPFTISDHPVQYRLNWRGQYAPKILTPQDRFFIGGRYSVRGFNGELMLSGDNGHYLQQEFSWNIPLPSTQLYAGIDQGWVNGRNSNPGQRWLMGAVFGARSYFRGVYVDAFAGHGLSAPDVIKKEWNTGFSINYSY